MCCVGSDDNKISRSLLSLPWYMVNAILTCVDLAEQRKGSAPNGVEVFVTFDELGYRNCMRPIDDVYTVCAILMSLLREHMILTDKVGYLFTRNKREGFFTYTEIFKNKYPGYGLAHDQSLVPLKGTTLVNFDDLWKILRSNDRALI